MWCVCSEGVCSVCAVKVNVVCVCSEGVCGVCAVKVYVVCVQ